MMMRVHVIHATQAHVRPRGRATWPCVPRRVHVGPRAKTPFLFIIIIF